MFFLLKFCFVSRYDIFRQCHTALCVSCKFPDCGMTFLRKVIPRSCCIFQTSVWHFKEKPYRPAKPCMTSLESHTACSSMTYTRARYDIFLKCHTDPWNHCMTYVWNPMPYLHFIFSATHTQTLFLIGFFQVFAIKLAGYVFQALKACLLLINHENKPNCCPIFHRFQPSRPSCTSLHRFKRVWPSSHRFCDLLAVFYQYRTFCGGVVWTDFKTLVFGFRS